MYIIYIQSKNEALKMGNNWGHFTHPMTKGSHRMSNNYHFINIPPQRMEPAQADFQDF